jgi:hypothetical protein
LYREAQPTRRFFLFIKERETRSEQNNDPEEKDKEARGDKAEGTEIDRT